MGAAHGSQLALDGLHVEVLVDTINFAVRDMEHEAAQELIVLPGGLERDRRKVRFSNQAHEYNRRAVPGDTTCPRSKYS